MRVLEDAGIVTSEKVGRVRTYQLLPDASRATYTDTTPYERIIYTYDMWLDGVHASTSITTTFSNRRRTAMVREPD